MIETPLAILLEITFYAILWHLLFQCCTHVVSPYLLGSYSTKYKALGEGKRSYWNASMVSSFHAILVSCMAVYAIQQGKLWSNWPHLDLAATTDLTHTTVRVMNGYMLADALLTVYYRDADSWHKSFYIVMFHHLMVLCLTCSILMIDCCHSYSMIGVLLELTTPMINLHWHLRTVNESETKLYFINGVVLVVMWFIVRIVVAGPVALYSFYIDEAVASRQVLVTVLIAYTGVYPLQVYWFIKLINGARKAFHSIGGQHKEGKEELVQKKQE
jgi:hypothetical protein